MKCPKCGSVMKGVYDRKYNRKCFNCGTMKKVDIKELEHQQRLDNVLSKFKKVMIKAESGNLTYLYQTNNDFIAIGYYEIENHFKLLTNIPSPPIISLNTVESLIKDLENEN